MKRSAFALLLLIVSHAVGASPDENVRAAQTQLRQEGFYFGDPSGVLDNETAAAVTRYQIRHGLQITGELDAATAKALGIAPPSNPAASAPSLSGTWRKLRSGEQRFVPAESRSSPNVSSRPAESTKRPASPPPTATPLPVVRGDAATTPFDRERLRDYVGAFVLAGLDPKVGAELEFFAERVNYFGDAQSSREKIRSDLLRYDARWPRRRFWLAGDLEVRPESDQRWRVSFPLRYELSNGSKRASGTVQKTLVLQKTGTDDLEIVAVNEKKLK